MISGQPITAAAPVPDVDYVLSLDRPALIDLWRETFGSPPPKHLSALFLQKAIAFEIQCRMTRGVPERVQKTLRAIASGKRVAAASAGALRTGTCLMREWNGRTYRVEVVEDGYVMDGRTYRSLSAIARRITGAQWSGPRFFGLG